MDLSARDFELSFPDDAAECSRNNFAEDVTAGGLFEICGQGWRLQPVGTALCINLVLQVVDSQGFYHESTT